MVSEKACDVRALNAIPDASERKRIVGTFVPVMLAAGANTHAMLSSVKHGSGGGVFMIMGTGLGISARWRGEHRLEISIPEALDVQWGAGLPESAIQFFDDKVKLVPRRT